MQTFDCPNCGAAVNYEPTIQTNARCSYCNSQLAVPNPYLGQGARVIKLDISPEVRSGAKKIFSVFLIVPILIVSGITFGAFWAPAMALLSDAADRIGLAQGLAFGLMNLAWGTGNALGPVLGGALADAAGDALPFLVLAVLCLMTLASLGVAGTRRLRVPESP